MDILCFSVNNWEKRRARKQQFMLGLAKCEDFDKVIYIEPPLNFFRLLMLPWKELSFSENRLRWLRALKFKMDKIQESHKLFIFTPIFFIPFAYRFYTIYKLNLILMVMIIKRKIKRLKDIILWIYHPFDCYILDIFGENLISIFDWAEEWSIYFSEYGPKKRNFIKNLEEKIIKKVDLVFTPSILLLEEAKKINSSTFLILDGTKLLSYEKRFKPQEIENIKKPIIAYLGTISKRVDLEILELLAKNLTEVSIVIIGNLHKEVNVSFFKKYPNIFFLGSRNYSDLVNYIDYFDVCVLPYIPEKTISLPTKIFDYLAIGKPIVSTDLIGISDFKEVVYIAKDKNDFLNLVIRALGENNSLLEEKRRALARENDWSKRIEEILEIIKNYIHEKKKTVSCSS